MSKKTDCPICNGDYFNLEMSYRVCEEHLDWIVTICDRCKRACYSVFIGGCPECYGFSNVSEDYADSATQIWTDSRETQGIGSINP